MTRAAPRPGDDPVADATVNRRYWDGYADEYQRTHRPMLDRPLAWGTFALPEADVGAFGDLHDLAGSLVLELGCGGAQWATALAGIGARPVGLDASARQLDHARRRMHRTRRSAGVPLVQAVGDALPFAARTFDLVLSDHGAMAYSDPEVTVPEVARVLRPEGRLLFNVYTPLLALCWDGASGRTDERLHEAASNLGRWEDETGFVSWDLTDGQWIRLLHRHGLVVEDLIELRAPAGASSTHHDAATTAWAQRWPIEQIWVTRRGRAPGTQAVGAAARSTSSRAPSSASASR